MSLQRRLVDAALRRTVRLLCRVDDSTWHLVPETGPLILAANHVNFVEVPAMVTHLAPRPITGFVKAENWDHWFLRRLFTLWEGIPLHRGEADVTAIRAALAALDAGKILAVAPEGTRTGDGRLRQAHPGIVVLALKANVPILPVAYYGHEAFWPMLRRLRRVDFHLRVGRPFWLDAGSARVTKPVRQQMADEIMYQIARLLPPAYRGYYADLPAATTQYLRFLAA